LVRRQLDRQLGDTRTGGWALWVNAGRTLSRCPGNVAPASELPGGSSGVTLASTATLLALSVTLALAGQGICAAPRLCGSWVSSDSD
jgi:hypothetical protein